MTEFPTSPIARPSGMTNKWTTLTIDDIKSDCDGAIAIGPFGSRMKADAYVPIGVPVIRGNNLSDTRAFQGEFVYVTDQTADSMRNCNAVADDLVFPHRGAIGEVGIVPNDRPRYMLSTSLMKLSCNRKKANPLFLFYFFRSPAGRHELLKNASTVGTPGIGQPLTSLRSIRVPLPPVSIQDRIAEILGTLDDKIELNRRMNETLEAMARRLFRSWFVDFDPVHAKAALRRQHAKLSNAELSRRALPNMSPGIAELFPDGFEDSPLGPIPKGWKAGTVGDIGDNPRRGVQPSEIPPDTPYIALEHMPRRCIALSEWDHADGVESGKFRFHHGEILFGKLRPYFHKVGVPAINGVCSTDVLVIVPNAAHWTALLLGHVSSDEMIAHADTSSTGTKMPRTNWGDIARFTIAIPTAAIGAAATNFVELALKRMHANILESRELKQARDRLLPKLLSGELLA